MEEGLWYTIFANKWFITAFLGVDFALSLIFILKIKSLYVVSGSIPVIIAAIIFYHQPIIPFVTAVIVTSIILFRSGEESQQWLSETWSFAKQILPLLALSVLIAGFFLGGPENKQGITPNEWITALVGGNSLFSNLFAAVVGAFIYFATITEVPIVQGLLNSGMGKGPALALLLAGLSLSLPNMLVIRGVIGTQKTVVYVTLVVILATISGMIFGSL